MPRVNLAAEKYAAEDLKKLVKYLLCDESQAEVADAIGICTRTLMNRKAKPEELRIWEIRKLTQSVRMSAEDKDKLRKLIVP
nr:MAG TPA: InsA C-terminal domain [Caudoviricetes sp.]